MTCTRREFVVGAVATTAGSAEAAVRRRAVYVGCYTGPDRRGIWLTHLDPESGHLAPPRPVAEAVNVSSMVLHPNGRSLFAVNEIGDFQGTDHGAVSAFRIEADGALRVVSQVSSRGGGPCYISLDRRTRRALGANYGGGSVAALPVRADGGLESASGFVQHPRTPGAAPHAHAIHIAPDNQAAFVSDLGLDRVSRYEYDAQTGRLEETGAHHALLPAASGPSNLCLHPDGRVLYALHETANRVTAYRVGKGLRELATVGTLPAGFSGKSWSGDVLCHPNGRVLYTSNCGHDSIARYALDREGRPTLLDHTPTGGKIPRGFILDAEFLVAANLESGSVVSFRIAPQDGALTPTGSRVEIPRPVCVRIQAEA